MKMSQSEAPQAGFVQLNVVSSFSGHYGTSTPAELVAVAAADGMPAVALTDRDGLYGVARYIEACQKHGMQPIVGANLEVEGRGRVTVLAQGSAEGYTALCRAVSAAHIQTPPVIAMEALAGFCLPEADDARPRLYVLVGPESDVGAAAAQRSWRGSRELLRQWRQELGQALYVEVVSHLAPPGEALSTAHAVRMLSAAKVCRVGYVLTNAVRMGTAEEAATADVLDAVRVLSDLESAPLQPTDQGYLKTTTEMRRTAEEIAHQSSTPVSAEELLSSAARLAQQCLLDPAGHMTWGIPKIPEASVIGIAGDAGEELRRRCEDGLAGKGEDPGYRQQLEHELAIIADLGLAGYFLTVDEVARLIRGLNIRVAARGSAVSSLVVHALGLSPIDPLAHGLIFERFLSRRRSTLPDIDLDVESARRHEIYREVVKRFGAERVALMSMMNAYRIRGAVRDAGLALGLPDEEIDELAKIMWRFPAKDFRLALAEKPELRGLAARIETERVSGRQQLDLLVDLTERLDRLPRHLSTHPCGVILGDSRLLDLTPVQKSGVTGLPMSQFGKDDMDPLGHIKLDILGVRMQSALSHAREEIERTTGEHIELDSIDFTDKATFDLIQSTRTLGCFQIESPGQRELVGKLIPRSLNDLIIDISLFRPGPMGSGMVRPFLERRHGYEQTTYPHPHLEDILAETHGVVIYHEQVMRIFHRMTDCGLDEADDLRRKMGKDKEHHVEEFFRTSAAKQDYSQEVIDEVWRILASFASFGFCKAHGSAFAIPTYQTAYLKTHYPAAFFAGLLEHDPGMYPLRLLVAEARHLGIPLLQMDVNYSTGSYRLEPSAHDGGRQWGIRMALTSLKGISQAEIRRIEREQPFDSLTDFRDRARVKSSVLLNLAKIGALDGFFPEGRKRRNDIVSWVRTLNAQDAAKRASRWQVQGQLALNLTGVEAAVFPERTAEPTVQELIATELDITGIDVTGHVMETRAEQLAQLGVTYARDLLSLRNGAQVRVAGIRVATQTPPMASGKRVVFISLDDGTGLVDLSFFEEAQSDTGRELFNGNLLCAEGIIRRTGPRALTVQAQRAWQLPSNISVNQHQAAA